MPYQENYAEDITNLTSGNRIIEKAIFRFAVPTDEIIADVIGDNEIGLDDTREFVALHFYDRNNNQLVHSVAVPFTEGFLYVRDSVERLDAEIAAGNNKSIQLGLEFWNPEDVGASLFGRYLSTVPAGTYNLLINFFSNELGTYNDKNWKISQINSNATELILEPIDGNKVTPTELGQFADKSIFITHFRPFMEFLFEKYSSPFPPGTRAANATADESSDLFEDLPQVEPYNEIIKYFFKLLQDTDPTAYNLIFVQNNFEYQTQLRKALQEILNGVYGDFLGPRRDLGDGTMSSNFVDRQINENKFRITNNNFEGYLQESLAGNLAKFRNKFPTTDVNVTYDTELATPTG